MKIRTLKRSPTSIQSNIQNLRKITVWSPRLGKFKNSPQSILELLTNFPNSQNPEISPITIRNCKQTTNIQSRKITLFDPLEPWLIRVSQSAHSIKALT